jgi:hypothetical protein
VKGNGSSSGTSFANRHTTDQHEEKEDEVGVSVGNASIVLG